MLTIKPPRRSRVIRVPYRALRPLRAALVVLLAISWLVAGSASAGAGRLGPGDEQLSSGEYFDRVIFVGAAGDEVVIELISSEFDPYLIVIDASESVLAQEDDTPGLGLGARLTLTLPAAGQYTVIVTSAFSGETGAYSLLISTPAQAAAIGSGSQAQTPAQTPTQTPSTPTTPPATGAQPRTVTGTAVDTHGRPIAGARVWIQPAITTGVVEVRTDANGRYIAEGLLDVPYNAKAWTWVEYGGRQVCLRLGMESPTDYDSFVATHGVVRNFVMKLTGPIEDLRSLDMHFGGMIRAMYAPAYSSSGGRLELTFTPLGPLVDGSTIAPFTRTIDPRHTEDVHGVPVGPYRVSVALVGQDGSRRPIRVSPDGWENHSDSVLVDWTGSGTCDNGSGFDWVYLYLEIPD